MAKVPMGEQRRDRFDRANYPRFWWRVKYFCLAVWYQVMHNRAVRL